MARKVSEVPAVDVGEVAVGYRVIPGAVRGTGRRLLPFVRQQEYVFEAFRVVQFVQHGVQEVQRASYIRVAAVRD